MDGADGRPRGEGDRALLVFLARTGSAVSEASGVNASDTSLLRANARVTRPHRADHVGSIWFLWYRIAFGTNFVDEIVPVRRI